MIILQGQYNRAKVFNDLVESSAQAQIISLLNSIAFKDTCVRIMPDVHAGAGCVIGFTSTINGICVPNLVGVDINCGMFTILLGKMSINFEEFDSFIREYIPYGTGAINQNVLDSYLPLCFQEEVTKISDKIGLDSNKMLKAIGSLGSGNHFIEINEDSNGNKYLVIHSGSRYFGFAIARYHQNIAKEYCEFKGYIIDKSLAYLEGDLMKDYLHDMKVASEFAKLNRMIMGNRIIKFLGGGYSNMDKFETVHNYISEKDNIVRKGAISAHENERLLIPISMGAGSILGHGKGNEDWNFSGPHGAGRLFSRTEAKRTLSLDEFKNSMKDIWTSCISQRTLDESPQAYKSIDTILENIGESIIIDDILRPIYNFKSDK